MLRDEPGKPEHPLLGIQHGAGNRAVAGLVALQRQGPAAGAVAAPHQELRRGSHGEEVKQAQRKLSRVQASALPLTEDGDLRRRSRGGGPRVPDDERGRARRTAC